MMRRFPVILMSLLLVSGRAQTVSVADSVPLMICGLNLVSADRMMTAEEVGPVCDVHANWASVIPYAFVPGLHEPGLVFNGKWQWVGEREPGIEAAIRHLHDQGIAVMVKPQLWIGHGAFSGELSMPDDSSWAQFEREYRGYIMSYAELAGREGAELLCIGTEMKQFVRERPDFWRQLIAEIREKYSGRLTYAENWDAYAQVPFWKELDYIGIDAYFPIASGRHPRSGQLVAGWKMLCRDLNAFSDTIRRKILFTEYGYRSIPNCAEAPWEYGKSEVISERAQLAALKALYETIWEAPCFAGGFLWKWYPDHVNAGGPGDDSYTVQNKKAEHLVRSVYGR